MVQIISLSSRDPDSRLDYSCYYFIRIGCVNIFKMDQEGGMISLTTNHSSLITRYMPFRILMCTEMLIS